jgi:hypothetical protein
LALRGLVEHTIRDGEDASFSFLINLTDEPVAIGDIMGFDGFEGDRLAVVGDAETIAPGGVAVGRCSYSTMDGPWTS